MIVSDAARRADARRHAAHCGRRHRAGATRRGVSTGAPTTSTRCSICRGRSRHGQRSRARRTRGRRPGTAACADGAERATVTTSSICPRSAAGAACCFVGVRSWVPGAARPASLRSTAMHVAATLVDSTTLLCEAPAHPSFDTYRVDASRRGGEWQQPPDVRRDNLATKPCTAASTPATTTTAKPTATTPSPSPSRRWRRPRSHFGGGRCPLERTTSTATCSSTVDDARARPAFVDRAQPPGGPTAGARRGDPRRPAALDRPRHGHLRLQTTRGQQPHPGPNVVPATVVAGGSGVTVRASPPAGSEFFGFAAGDGGDVGLSVSFNGGRDYLRRPLRYLYYSPDALHVDSVSPDGGPTAGRRRRHRPRPQPAHDRRPALRLWRCRHGGGDRGRHRHPRVRRAGAAAAAARGDAHGGRARALRQRR